MAGENLDQGLFSAEQREFFESFAQKYQVEVGQGVQISKIRVKSKSADAIAFLAGEMVMARISFEFSMTSDITADHEYAVIEVVEGALVKFIMGVM